MTRGFLIYSFDSQTVQYSRLANVFARLCYYFTGEKTSVVTDSAIGLESALFDQIILKEAHIENPAWRNTERESYFELSPYDETIVIDSDYLQFNSHLVNLFGGTGDLLFSNQALKINLEPVELNEQRLSDLSLDMTWATCFLFRKTKIAKQFFDLVSLIRSQYEYYYRLYRVNKKVYRNDHVFSIAKHILSAQMGDAFAANPYPIYTAYPNVKIVEVQKTGLLFLYNSSNPSVRAL
jgi:hypothetical protein